MDKTALARRIYITYKSRINAAERMKKTNSFIQGINIYYSLFLTVLSIYGVNAGTQKLSLIITVYSVVVTVTIVYLAAQNYGERAKNLKSNYVAIFKLRNSIKDNMSDDELQKISDAYDDLIDCSENHTEYDYFKAVMAMRDEKSTLVIRQKIIYYFTYYGSIVLRVFLIVLPFLLQHVVDILERLISI